MHKKKTKVQYQQALQIHAVKRKLQVANMLNNPSKQDFLHIQSKAFKLMQTDLEKLNQYKSEF